ncbi:MAG: gamma-glutamyltransferase [Aestuariibacter sp.]
MNLIHVVVASLFLSSLSFADEQSKVREDREPEAATGVSEKKARKGTSFMVTAAHPYASWAGRRIIDQGGSAIDAAIAVQAMLTLVEPQSSGLGGGAFILYFDNKTKTLHTFDGRETAPQAANAFLFMQGTRKIPWRDAVVGGRSVGVPGVLRALELAHSEFGRISWDKLFADAALTAENGFEVTPRLEKLVALDMHPGLHEFIESKMYFHPAGKPIKAGFVRKNRRLAKTLNRIASEGADYFYEGEVAKRIAEKVQKSPINPGLLTKEDISNYRAKKRDPVCGTYRTYRICGMAPPASGGISVLQILKMLEPFNMQQYEPNEAEAIHLFTQASKLAYADRDMYIADTDFTNIPFAALINSSYLSRRAEYIAKDKSIRWAKPGEAYAGVFLQKDDSYELPNTSHIAIVDKEGNAVSMTSSIEYAFGSGLMVEGFLLNNQLTDFAFSPSRGGYRVLNRVEPGKRPRSSMSPTMVFDDKGKLVLVIGSPGGSRIISYVAQTIIAVLDWGLDIQQAINLPKVTNRNDYTALERGTGIEALQEPLKKLGHNVKIIDLNSGLHGVQLKDGVLIGGADPRREGIAVGR